MDHTKALALRYSPSPSPVILAAAGIQSPFRAAICFSQRGNARYGQTGPLPSPLPRDHALDIGACLKLKGALDSRCGENDGEGGGGWVNGDLASVWTQDSPVALECVCPGRLVIPRGHPPNVCDNGTRAFNITTTNITTTPPTGVSHV